MVPVVKKNGSVRICVDFKQLNKAVKRPHCMLPNLDDVAPKMSGATVFSTLDAASGFFQIPVTESSMKFTTFLTPFGRYCFQRVPMGISLGPEVFQTKMKEVLKGLDGCDAIMDDTIVYGKSTEEHDQRLEAVMARVRESGLKLNKAKCRLRQKEVKYFGHIVSSEGIRPDPDKVSAIRNMPAPTSLTELRTVCGMFNYMTKFVPGMATIMKPMTDLMKKQNMWIWGPAQQEAFEQVKKKIAESPALGFFDPTKDIVVCADSSSYGIGATIMQREGENLVPIAFASRTLTEAECRYAQIEKELLASVWACEKFSKYLVGLDRFELQTDHKPLVPLIASKDINTAPIRCQRLLIRMMRFNAHVMHLPGKSIVIADTLSRHLLPHTVEDMELELDVTSYMEGVESHFHLTSRKLDHLRAETVHDTQLQQVISYVLNGWPKMVAHDVQAYQQAQGELSVVNGLVVFGNRVVIPASQRQRILHQLHESHQGLHKCRQRAQITVWWPGLSRDLKELINRCETCRLARPAQKSEPLQPTPLPQRPWQKLGADLCQHRGKNFLIVVDYYSRWLEILLLKSTTASVVIKKLRYLFSTHGMPDVIVSDNGPQFRCKEFRDFAQECDFYHQTSSPGFPQANGEAESAVKIAKKILQQESPDTALLNYRATPHTSTGVSPSVALMGRQLKTKLPTLPQNLAPQAVKDAEIRKFDQAVKVKATANFNKQHGAVPLGHLKPGDDILVHADNKWEKPGTVVAADPDNRTYLINTPTGVLRRNRRHLQQLWSGGKHGLAVTATPTELPQDLQVTTTSPVPPQASPAAARSSVLQSESQMISSCHTPQRPATRSQGGYVAMKPERYRDST